MGHDPEIEKRTTTVREYRVSCNCGLNGPWRLTRKTANRNTDAHLDRAAEAES